MSTTQTVTGAVTLLYGTQGSGTSTMLIVNLDAANTIWVNESAQVQYGGPVGVPVQPGASISMTATQGLWAVAAPGITVQIALIPNGTSYFFPASLTNLGGVKVYIQAGQPTGTIPVNSIWLQTDADGVVIAFSTFDGTDWVPQQFNASEVLAVGTIVANLIAAGQVYAGIVNGTTIEGALFVVDNAAGGFFAYAGTPGAGNLVGWMAQAPGTDPYGNQYTAGLVLGPAGGPQVALTPSGSATGSGAANFPTGAPDEASPLSVYSQVLSTTGGSPYLAGQVQGPSNAGDASGEQFSMILTSASDDGTADATMAFTDVFGLAYLILSNSGASQMPALGIGTTVPGSAPAPLTTPAAVTAALNGVVAAYGASQGGTVTKTFTASGSWTPPAGVTSAAVEAWGGGAGGQWASGPGGGGGEYASQTVTVVPADTYTVTVGGGGAGGTSSSGTGKAGGNSSFSGPSATTVTAHGAPVNNTSSSTGGTGSANSVHHNGGGTTAGSTGPGNGGSGGATSGSPAAAGSAGHANSGAQPGTGVSLTGAGSGGGGGWGGNSPTTGGAGGIPGGGGGSGGASSSSGDNGGAGARGQVKITYTLPSSDAVISMSLASQAGTDLAGNAYPAGYMGQAIAVNPVSGGAETWHNFNPLATGFSVPTGGYAQYKLYPDDTVGIRGYIQIAINSGPGTSWKTITNAALPAAYWPASDQYSGEIGYGTLAVVSGSNNAGAGIRLNTDGSIAVTGFAATDSAAMNIVFNARFPLD